MLSGASSAPAPTSYNLSGALGADHRDFNRAECSRMFQKPIAERPLSSKSELPAPNQYDVRVQSLSFATIVLYYCTRIGLSRIETNHQIEQCHGTSRFPIAYETIAGPKQTFHHTGAWCVGGTAPADAQWSLDIESVSGTYNLDESGIRPSGPVHQSIFKSTSKRDAFGSQASGEVCTRYRI